MERHPGRAPRQPGQPCEKVRFDRMGLNHVGMQAICHRRQRPHGGNIERAAFRYDFDSDPGLARGADEEVVRLSPREGRDRCDYTCISSEPCEFD